MKAVLYTFIFVCIGYCHINVIFSLQIVIVLRQVENLEEHLFIKLKFSWSLLIRKRFWKANSSVKLQFISSSYKYKC